MSDKSFMQQALDLANYSVENGGGPFGAVVVRDGTVIGRGHNRVVMHNDPTAHAEMEAIRDACRQVGDFHLDGALLYVNCEPCPMCLSAAYWAHIERIYYAVAGSVAAEVGFDDVFIHREMALPPEQRSLACELLPIEDGDAAFKRWQAKADRVDY